MKRFFARNITNAGRLVRALFSVGLFVGAFLIFHKHPWVALGLAAFAILALFEALRGWCIMRACGFKTRL
jgi:Protein of unknown function (DUF2892)